MVKAIDGLKRPPQLFDQDLSMQLIGLDDGRVLSQRCSGLDGTQARFDDPLEAHVVGFEEDRQRGLARTLDLLERWPARDKVAEQHRIALREPFKGLGVVLLERVAQAVYTAGLIPYQPAALLDQ